MNDLALPATVADLVDEYAAKDAAVEKTIAIFNDAWDALGMAATVAGTFADSIGNKPYLHAQTLRKNLLKSGWQAVYNRLNIDRVATAKDKQLFKRTLADPPPLTFDNAKATFRDYLIRPRYHILRGLAEVFVDLDPAYKSHSKVKIGVKGLPKRIILTNFGGFYGYAYDKFRDMVNALAAYQNKPIYEYEETRLMEAAFRAGEDAVLDGTGVLEVKDGVPVYAPDRGLTVRKYANGNAHVFFDKATLLDINRALAEFYGDVLPDAEPEGVKPTATTAVAKDLQFYWTPREVVEKALEFADIYAPRDYTREAPPAHKVLEPSCGDGRILDVLREYGCRAIGIEYHPGRAAEARAKGHAVLLGNFLEQPPTPEFDKVVMNPPFYGRHYLKHVAHAMKFLRPGGVLVAVLPATARYDHGELKGEWRDLPVGSFTEAGTNVPTVLFRIVKKDVA